MCKNSVESKYNNLIASARAQTRYEFGPQDRVYVSLIEALYKSALDPYDDISIVERTTANWIKHVIENSEKDFPFSEYIENLKKNIEINRRQHLLVVPLEGSQCSADIISESFRVLTGTPDQKIKKLVELSGITPEEGNYFADHTERNKTPGFFSQSLLVLTQRAHTSTVRFRAPNLVRLVMYTIRMYYLGYVRGTTRDPTPRFRIRSMADFAIEKTDGTTIAIWSDEYYSFSHEYTRDKIDFCFDLDFISNGRPTIEAFISSVVLNINRSDFNSKMLNALFLANKAFQLERGMEPNISLLVLISAIESLLCENKGEKKLRFSSLLPRFAGTNKSDIGPTARNLSILYNSRNKFVHAAEEEILDHLIPEDSIRPLILVSQ